MSKKIALVTGANRGIGLEVAKELLQKGWKVYLGTRSKQNTKEAERELEGDFTWLTLDVSKSASIDKAVEAFEKHENQLDVLVNNAGIYPDEGLEITTISRDQMKETFDTNTFGVLEVTQAFQPLLEKAKSARVINVSSGYGQLDSLSADVPSYCLSKLALNGLTIMLASSLKKSKISVNSVCPGWVRTDMGGSNANRSVEEGAETIVWLADEAKQSLTGKFFRDKKEIDW